MSRATAVVPSSTYRVFGPGQVCLDADAGDLVLVRHKSLVSSAIRGFERLRVPREFCWTNHAAITLNAGPNATVSQEGWRGDVATPLADLGAETFAVVHFDMTEEQRDAVVAFGMWALGHGYGVLTIVADAFNALTGLELFLDSGNRMVCSTQACRALERAGLIPDRSPYAVTPARLAQFANVVLPTPIMSTLAAART